MAWVESFVMVVNTSFQQMLKKAEPDLVIQKTKVRIFQRKGANNHFSLERVYSEIIDNAPEDIEFDVYTVSFDSRGLLNRFLICIEVAINSCNINHIAGDITFSCLFLRRRGLVISIPDCVMLERLSGVKRLVYWLFWLKIPMIKAQYITTLSDFSKSQLAKVLNRRCKEMVTIPVPPAAIFRQSARHEINNNSTFTILIIGTAWNKNLERIFCAVSSLRVRIKLVGIMTDEAASLAKLHKVNLKVYTAIDDRKLVDVYQASDVLLFPSLYEGFGMPLLEAQALGVPVITSSLPPMSEVAGMGAYLVDPYDIDDIRKSIIELSSNQSRREELIKAGYKNLKMFEERSIYSKYYDIYRGMAK